MENSNHKDFKAIKLQFEEKIGWLILNRPDHLNALNREMRAEIREAFERCKQKDSVRVVIIKGEGDKAFCAGVDIGEFEETAPHEFAEISKVFTTPANFPKPVIAAIDGYALGGGMELSLACDFRIATRRSQLGQPEINLGLIPGGGGTQRLPRIVGLTKAKELVMTGKQISAEEAKEFGIINKVVTTEKLEEEVVDFAKELTKGPLIALRVAKEVMNKGTEISLEAALQLERQGFSLLLRTADAEEGIEAFLEKRKPEFTGK